MFSLENLLQEIGLFAAFLPIRIPQMYTWYGFWIYKIIVVCFVAQRCTSDGLQQISHREECIFSAILGFDLSELTPVDRWARGSLSFRG